MSEFYKKWLIDQSKVVPTIDDIMDAFENLFKRDRTPLSDAQAGKIIYARVTNEIIKRRIKQEKFKRRGKTSKGSSITILLFI